MSTTDESPSAASEDAFWLNVARWIRVATVVVVGLVVAFIWAANRPGDRSLRGGAAAAGGHAGVGAEVVRGGAVTAEDPEVVWAKAGPLFGATGETYFAARAARDSVLENGRDADLVRIVAGGVSLAERGHYFAAKGDGTRSAFGDYCKAYAVARNGGMSHDEAIATLDQQAAISIHGR